MRLLAPYLRPQRVEEESSSGFPLGMGSHTQNPLVESSTLKRESLRNSLNRSVKIHDLAETDDLTLFLSKSTEDGIP